MLAEFGETRSGRVVDENDWPGRNPRLVTPAVRKTGTVVGIYTTAPNVVKILAGDGQIYVIRTDA